MKTAKIITLIVLLIPGFSQADSLSDTQKKELTLFGMKAMGLNVGIVQVKKGKRQTNPPINPL